MMSDGSGRGRSKLPRLAVASRPARTRVRHDGRLVFEPFISQGTRRALHKERMDHPAAVTQLADPSEAQRGLSRDASQDAIPYFRRHAGCCQAEELSRTSRETGLEEVEGSVGTKAKLYYVPVWLSRMATASQASMLFTSTTCRGRPNGPWFFKYL